VRYLWPVLWLAARAEADEATRARDRREEIPDDTAARHRALASRAAASVHVSNILAKLGVASRVEAAAVAHRLGVTG